MDILREQITRWIRQAEHDLESAGKLVEHEAFDHAAFLAQQATEKSLKAAWIKRLNQTTPRTHDIIRLAIDLSAPKNVVDAARTMASDYMATRYPDLGEEIPADSYTRDDAQERLEAATLVLNWAREQLS